MHAHISKVVYFKFYRGYDQVVLWEQEAMFSHCHAAASYYDAVMRAMTVSPLEVTDIPKNMVAEGYSRLQAFISGHDDRDPRQEPDMFRTTPTPVKTANKSRSVKGKSKTATGDESKQRKTRKRKAPSTPAPATKSKPGPGPSGLSLGLGSRSCHILDMSDSDAERTEQTQAARICTDVDDDAIPAEDAEEDPTINESFRIAARRQASKSSLPTSEPGEASDAVPAEAPVNEPQRFRPAALLPETEAGLAEPVCLEAKVRNDGHKHVLSHLLPMLRQVMRDDQFCRLGPRPQVKQALDLLDSRGARFWGTNQLYSRRRTVEDLVLRYYYDDVRRLL